MKNKFLPISLIAVSLLLTGCALFSDDGKWREEWGTPELFLENVIGYKNVFMYENSGNYKDDNFEIRDLIKESGPFESIKKSKPTVERYITYSGYWQPATSGPNYVYMSIWDDGLIRIHHKKSLGPHGYAYFTMDADKATDIIDVVFAKSKEMEESDVSESSL